MSAWAIAWLLLPLAVMIAGFLLAIRVVVRSAGRPIDGHTEGGRPALRSEADARLVEVFGRRSVGGPGSLLLTDRDLRFERFFPRREFRIGLDRIREVSAEDSGARGDRLRVEWLEGEDRAGIRLRLPGAEAWAAAIRQARASLRPDPGSPPEAQPPLRG